MKTSFVARPSKMVFFRSPTVLHVNLQDSSLNLMKCMKSSSLLSIRPHLKRSVLPKSASNFSTTDSAELMTIKVRVLTTWEKSEFVSLSEIDVLNKNKVPIPVQSISSDCVDQDKACLQYLVNRVMIKTDKCKQWSSPICEAYPVTLIIKVNRSDDPCQVRMWNAACDCSMSVKNFQVFVDDHLVFEGELPKKFGQVVSLTVSKDSLNSNSLPILYQGIKRQSKKTVMDSYGEFLVKDARCITLEILDTYSLSSQAFCLGAIQFYDYSSSLIDPDDGITVSLKGSESYVPVTSLLKRTDDLIQAKEKWIAFRKGDQRPSIQFCFHADTKVSEIRIWNIKSIVNEQNCAVRRCHIRVNGSSAWIGTLKMCQSGLDQPSSIIRLCDVFA